MQRKVKAISIARLVHQTPEESSASSPPSSSSRVPISSAAAHHTFAQRRRISALLCVHVFTTSSWFIHESSSWKRENTHHLILSSNPLAYSLLVGATAAATFLADIAARSYHYTRASCVRLAPAGREMISLLLSALKDHPALISQYTSTGRPFTLPYKRIRLKWRPSFFSKRLESIKVLHPNLGQRSSKDGSSHRGSS
jgi:hypothetical protein